MVGFFKHIHIQIDLVMLYKKIRDKIICDTKLTLFKFENLFLKLKEYQIVC